MTSLSIRSALPLLVVLGLDPKDCQILSPPSSQESLSKQVNTKLLHGNCNLSFLSNSVKLLTRYLLMWMRILRIG